MTGTKKAGYLPKNTIRYNNYYYDISNNLSKEGDYNSNFNPYNWNNNNQPGLSQIWNQPLGYTDIGTGRPYAGKPGYDQYGTPI